MTKPTVVGIEKPTPSAVEVALSMNELLFRVRSEAPQIGKTDTANIQKGGKTLYSYNFAPLDKIFDVYKPILENHGLYVEQLLGGTVMEGKPYLTLRTVIHDRSGRLDPLVSPEFIYPITGDTHIDGGNVTYFKRYQFNALMGIAPGGEDDDGKQSVERKSAASEKLPPKIQLVKDLMEQTATVYTDVLDHYEVRSISDMTPVQLQDLTDVLLEKKAMQAQEKKDG